MYDCVENATSLCFFNFLHLFFLWMIITANVFWVLCWQQIFGVYHLHKWMHVCMCVCVYAREKKFLTCTLNFLQGKHIKNKKIARLNKLISFRIWTVWILVSDLLKAKLRIRPIKDLKKNSNVHICIASLTHTECFNKLLVFDGWSLKLLIQHSLRTFTHHVCLACRKKTSSAISLLTLPCSEHVCSLPCQPGQGMLVSSEALILATHVQLH